MKKSDSGSFRDPNGFVFYNNGQIFRQINRLYFPQFEKLINSGLYGHLSEANLLVKHEVVSKATNAIIIKPETVPFVSYPYEWSFNMLLDAALLTLRIQKIALEYGMILKDASAYNVQFIGTRPIFIDSLSFDVYKIGETWVGYKQFCQHFLVPLTLMSFKDLRMSLLMREFIDGIPLDLASKLLPLSTKFNFPLLANIHLHAKNQKRMAYKKVDLRKYTMSKFQMTSLIDNLENTIRSISINKSTTEWEKYYTFSNYSDTALQAKHKIITKFIKMTNACSIIDFGANNGEFSKLAAKNGVYVIACDIDPLAVNHCYLKNNNNPYLLPLIIDITNPSPAIGWANTERKSFTQRAEVDLVVVLALVHHLAISNNLPLEMIARYLSKCGKYLIIEFVPKEDSKVKILLQNRTDIFNNYNQKKFEAVFRQYFKLIKKDKIKDSKRIVYLFRRK